MPSGEVGPYSCHVKPYINPLSTITPDEAKRDAKALFYFLPWSMIGLMTGDSHPLECRTMRSVDMNYAKARKTCPIAPV